MPGDRPSEGGWPSLDDPFPDWWPMEYRRQYRGWWVWRGIAGLHYGRKLLTSPPRVVRGEDPEDLRDQIKREEANIESGTWRGHSPGAI